MYYNYSGTTGINKDSLKLGHRAGLALKLVALQVPFQEVSTPPRLYLCYTGWGRGPGKLNFESFP